MTLTPEGLSPGEFLSLFLLQGVRNFFFPNSWNSCLLAPGSLASLSAQVGVEGNWSQTRGALCTKLHFISSRCLLTHWRIQPKINIRSALFQFIQSGPWKTGAVVCPALLASLRGTGLCVTSCWLGFPKGNILQQQEIEKKFFLQ